MEEADFLGAKTRNTPWDSHLAENNEKLPYGEIVIFRRTLGQLAYLANGTRPDLSWAVSILASEISFPSRSGWERMKRLLRYLNGTKELALRCKPLVQATRMNTYVDSSFAVDKRRGRSVTGFIIYLNGGTVLWKSRLQPTVSDSPNATEYVALYEASQTAMGMCKMVGEVGVKLESGCYMHKDNDGSRRLAMSGMGQKRHDIWTTHTIMFRSCVQQVRSKWCV